MQHTPGFQSNPLELEPILSLVFKAAHFEASQPLTTQPLGVQSSRALNVDVLESSIIPLPDALPLVERPVISYSVLAQSQQFDQDFLGHAGNLLNGFVESGQIWALLIGIVLGYLIRGMTTYS